MATWRDWLPWTPSVGRAPAVHVARPLADATGRPVDTRALREEQAAPTLSGVRSILTDHPTRGLTPARLARILVGAEQGDAIAYLELAEDMEEKDLHYLGVLGTRKRQVSQLEITVEAASDDTNDVENADLVREWLKRDALQTELFDVLDAVGKGFSQTEIIWDTSESQWWPAQLKWRDPRWFQFDLVDGESLRLRDPTAPMGLDLPPFKYVAHIAKAKSGLPIRGGLARAAAWCWMFKNFALKDWVVFSEVYGQPIRIGKYPQSASDADRQILLRAVTMLGSDAAAIIPEGMLIDLLEAKSSGAAGAAGGTVFQGLATFLDSQVSKAVLGQTGTTDNGPYAGTARVHDEVRADIETADANQLAATLTRDLAIPLVMLNRGSQKKYPAIRVGRAEQIDRKELADVLAKLVPIGLKVGMSEVRDRIGLPDPADDEELLQLPAGGFRALPPGEMKDIPGDQAPAAQMARLIAAVNARDAGGRSTAPEAIAGQADRQSGGAMDRMIGKLADLVANAGSLDAVAAGLLRAYPEMDPAGIAGTLQMALALADLVGRADIADGK